MKSDILKSLKNSLSSKFQFFFATACDIFGMCLTIHDCATILNMCAIAKVTPICPANTGVLNMNIIGVAS